MIRILQCVNNMHRAGLETMLMNYYRQIDRSRIQFDFLTHRPERSDYDDEIERLGGRVYYAPRLYPQHYAAYFSFMKNFFREHPEYQIVHSHIDAMSYLPLRAAKKAGVPIRIAHSHSTSIDRDFKYPLKQLFRKRMLHVANHCCACGDEAGKFLFGRHDFTLIPNAIDAARFAYDAALRRDVRADLALEDRLVIGHVGRFSYPKNHLYLLEIFAQIRKLRPDAALMLVGTGEKEQEIRTRADEMSLTEHIRFMGSRDDVHRLYQAMDAFVMPSLFEGVPLTGVEAQFAQLPCIFSDKVPDEVAFTPLCRFVPLAESPAVWAAQVLDAISPERGRLELAGAKYDIRCAHERLTDYYLHLLDTIDERKSPT